MVLNQTPFYGESGGQVGDTGMITGPDGLRIAVTDTQKKLGDLFVHLGRVEAGEARVGTPVVAEVDHARRTTIRAHHSATHLLHEALRRRLGTHVTQKGSLNAPDRLRFDVSQPRPITPDDLAGVEAEVNARIRENTEVTTRLMTPDAAVEMGAMALFGEKYGEEVRVVAMGAPRGQQAGLVDRAVRRHACPAHRRYRLFQDRLPKRGRRRRAPHRGGDRRGRRGGGRGERTVAARGRRRAARQPGRGCRSASPRCWTNAAGWNARSRSCSASWPPAAAAAEVEEVNGVKLAARNLGEVPARDLKGLADAIGKQLGSGVVALVSTAEGKASIVVGVSPDLTGRFNAVELVRAASAAVGGKGGGGRPDMAQAGGPDGAQADAALARCGRHWEDSRPAPAAEARRA